MSLNTTNRCEHCAGVVTNIEGRRHTLTDLERIHNDACPGLHRRTKNTAKPTT